MKRSVKLALSNVLTKGNPHISRYNMQVFRGSASVSPDLEPQDLHMTPQLPHSASPAPHVPP